MANSKGRLQELFQGRGVPLPQYNISTSGQPHCPLVECTVTVHWNNKVLREKEVCRGKKKEAEKLAAAKMLKTLEDLDGGGGGGGRQQRRTNPRCTSLSPTDYRRVSLSPASSPHRSSSPLSTSSPHRSSSPLSTRQPSQKSTAAIPGERLMACIKAKAANLPLPQYREVDEETYDISSPLFNSLSPQYHYWYNDPGESPRISCLACAREGKGGKAYHVTGHGSGETEAIARTQASRSLLANFVALTEET